MGFPAKPDWDACKARYAAWWNREDIGRAGLHVTAPKSAKQGARPDFPPEVEARWTDWAFTKAMMEYTLQNTYYGGEAFPIWHGGYPGWDALPVFLGCEVTLDEETGWWEPIIASGELAAYRPEDLRIDRQGDWFQLSQKFLALIERGSRGCAVPTSGAFGGGGDTLAALRGTEQLLYDMKDDPDAVRAMEMRMMEIWIEHYQERYDILSASREGSAGWFNLWSPGKFYAAQCDFSYMISTPDFERCFLPAIDMQVRYLDHSVYHVDGIGAFKHVGALCALPNLDALQILPGAGMPSPLCYPEVLRQVQNAGKNLHITIPASEVKQALSMLDPRGLMIDTWAETEDEAKDLIALVEKSSRQRK